MSIDDKMDIKEAYRLDLAELSQAIDEFEAALVPLRESVDDLVMQSNVCLSSRTAAARFMMVGEMRRSLRVRSERSVPAEYRDRLTSCFDQALVLLPLSSAYRPYVDERFDEFKTYCEQAAARQENDTALFRFAGVK
jgi:hypothetical protein